MAAIHEAAFPPSVNRPFSRISGSGVPRNDQYRGSFAPVKSEKSLFFSRFPALHGQNVNTASNNKKQVFNICIFFLSNQSTGLKILLLVKYYYLLLAKYNLD